MLESDDLASLQIGSLNETLPDNLFAEAEEEEEEEEEDIDAFLENGTDTLRTMGRATGGQRQKRPDRGDQGPEGRTEDEEQMRAHPLVSVV